MDKDSEELATKATTTMSDPRVHHYWSPDAGVGQSISRSLGLVRQLPVAWKVFLVFDPDVDWGGPTDVPEPTAWMHDLAKESPRSVSPARLQRVIQALLPE